MSGPATFLTAAVVATPVIFVAGFVAALHLEARSRKRYQADLARADAFRRAARTDR